MRVLALAIVFFFSLALPCVGEPHPEVKFSIQMTRDRLVENLPPDLLRLLKANAQTEPSHLTGRARGTLTLGDSGEERWLIELERSQFPGSRSSAMSSKIEGHLNYLQFEKRSVRISTFSSVYDTPMLEWLEPEEPLLVFQALNILPWPYEEDFRQLLKATNSLMSEVNLNLNGKIDSKGLFLSLEGFHGLETRSNIIRTPEKPFPVESILQSERVSTLIDEAIEEVSGVNLALPFNMRLFLGCIFELRTPMHRKTILGIPYEDGISEGFAVESHAIHYHLTGLRETHKFVGPLLGIFQPTSERLPCNSQLKNYGTALEMYELDHDEYPSSLNKLAPEYMSVLESCPMSEQPYLYQRTSGGYLVRCPLSTSHKHGSFTRDEGLILEND